MTKNLSQKQCISQNDQEKVSKKKFKSKWAEIKPSQKQSISQNEQKTKLKWPKT